MTFCLFMALFACITWTNQRARCACTLDGESRRHGGVSTIEGTCSATQPAGERLHDPIRTNENTTNKQFPRKSVPMKQGFRVMKKDVGQSFSLLVLCCFATACAAPLIAFGLGAAGGIAGYKYHEGQTVVVYEAPFVNTWDATLAALEEMQMQVESSSHTMSTGQIKAKRPDREPVYISVKYQSANRTEVKIGVGSLGNRQGSDAIAKQIREVLFES